VRLLALYETPDKDGETRRQYHLRFDSPELNPDIEEPADGGHIIEWFWDLHRGRPEAFSGVAAISPEYLASWAAMTGEIVTREEVAILRRMDAAFRAALADELDHQESRKRKAPNG
jgi:hypothetical protein